MSRMKKKKDKKVFTRTAAKSKKINIAPKIFRGGIRLCVSIKRMEQDPNLFAVCAFDRMNESVPFSRVYSLDDIRCITHASDIFWRYLK